MIFPSRFTACTAVVLALSAPRVEAQNPRVDTLELGTLQDSALLTDPRSGQVGLLAEQSRRRLSNISAERLPVLSAEAQAQYQSDVARIPITLPGGITPPVPPHDTYDARLAANQRLYDPGIGARRAVEVAQLVQSQSRVRTLLYSLRQQVNDAFFAVLLAQSHIEELRNSVTGLEAQLAVAGARVREGTALASEENLIRAELLQLRQTLAQAGITRTAALVLLQELTGASTDTAVRLLTPDLADAVARARAAVGSAEASLRARPEYDAFASTRELLERQERARAAQDKPRVSAFGRLGYGRPGLNPLNDTFDSYWLAGVQLQWTLWSWSASRRDREVLTLQRRIISTEEDAFTAQLHRAVTNDLAAVDRLEAALAADEEIIGLRERIAEEARLRFAESAVTSAEYIERQTELLNARITRGSHRVALAQARARFLTTLGIGVR